jgi:hypothetical protein
MIVSEIFPVKGYQSLGGHGFQDRGGFPAYQGDFGPGQEQVLNLTLAHAAAADHQTRLAVNIEKNRVNFQRQFQFLAKMPKI